MNGDGRNLRRIATAAAIVLAPGLGAWTASLRIPVWAATGMLHPPRRAPPARTDLPHEDLVLESAGVRLVGWRFRAPGERRGLVVYLHGLCDDRRESAGLARRYTQRGFDVVAYDSRAHGESGGDACTYGALEKGDLARILDAEREGPVALIGGSLGGAVALEAAALDPRVSLVVAIAPFSDLRTLELERAPWYATESEIDESFRIAEQVCGLRLEAASPGRAARKIRCPVLLVHGSADQDTPPSHSEQILEALAGRKRLILEPGRGHHDPLDAATWDAIDEAILATARDAGAAPPH